MVHKPNVPIITTHDTGRASGGCVMAAGMR